MERVARTRTIEWQAALKDHRKGIGQIRSDGWWAAVCKWVWVWVWVCVWV